MGGNPLKRSVVRLLKNRPLGVPAAIACRLLGARELSRKISRECNFVPDVVDVRMPAALMDGGGFLMHGAGGSDQVARGTWLHGWYAFEKPMPDLFGACSRGARCVYDVGSYSGFYSLLAATCDRQVEVFAFEPYPAARASLTKNIALNGLSGRVHVVPAAVSDRPGQADFYVPPNEHGWMETASSLDGQFKDSHAEVIKVDVVTLDAFRRAGAGRGPVELMKVDVESLEHRVLDGARRILAEDRPIIFLEVLTGNPACPQLDAIRGEAGYVDGVLLADGIDWRDHVEGLDQGRPHMNNHVLCPAEKKDRLEEIARSFGYRISTMRLEGSGARA